MADGAARTTNSAPIVRDVPRDEVHVIEVQRPEQVEDVRSRVLVGVAVGVDTRRLQARLARRESRRALADGERVPQGTSQRRGRDRRVLGAGQDGFGRRRPANGDLDLLGVLADR